MNRKLILAVILAATSVVGCSRQDDGEAPLKAPLRNAAVSQADIDLTKGVTDPKQVGIWKNSTQIYSFRSNGTFELLWDRMVITRPGRSERRTGRDSGKWSVIGNRLMLQSDQGPKTKFALDRAFAPDAKSFELRATYVKPGHGDIFVRGTDTTFRHEDVASSAKSTK
jgi:hypothetical protein